MAAAYVRRLSAYHAPTNRSPLRNQSFFFFSRSRGTSGMQVQLRMAPEAGKTTAVAVAVAVALTCLVAAAAAQHSGCSSVMMTLSPCLDYISSKSPLPGFACCTTLGSVVQTDPRCLCMIMDGSAAAYGIAINHTRALELPGVCKVQAPPVSQCKGVPASPAAAPSDALATNAEAADAPKGSADSNATSNSTSSKNPTSLMATLLIIPASAMLYAF